MQQFNILFYTNLLTHSENQSEDNFYKICM